MTERRCPGCAQWYSKSEGDCPSCGEPSARVNKGLVVASLNSHLYGMATNSVKEDEMVLKGR